jgi:hypothetical protein
MLWSDVADQLIRAQKAPKAQAAMRLQTDFIACFQTPRAGGEIGIGAPFLPQIVVRQPPEFDRRGGNYLFERSDFFPVSRALLKFAPVQRFPKEIKQRQCPTFHTHRPNEIENSRRQNFPSVFEEGNSV